MKIKLLSLALLMVSVVAFGQKREIRNAEKALENNELSKAKALIEKVEPQIASEKDKVKADFYAVKGDLYFFMSQQFGSLESLKSAAKSYQKVMKFGKDSEKEEAINKLDQLRSMAANSGLEESKSHNFEQAAKNFHFVYSLYPQDTIYLFAAANNAYYAENDEVAIKYFEKLRNMGYEGRSLQYTAKNASTGEVEVFGNKTQRDLLVKTGKYTDPGLKRAESKAGDVVKQLALLYLRNNKKDKALEAIKEAVKANPNDVQMLKAQVIIYQKMGKTDKIDGLLSKLITADPDNADKYYLMLGDIMQKSGKRELAKKNYKKAIEANAENVEAYRGMANIYLSKQEKVVKEMNSLGMSDADMEKYNQLGKKREALLKKALPYMEKALKYEPENKELIRSLYQISLQFGKTEKAKKYKKMMDSLNKG